MRHGEDVGPVDWEHPTAKNMPDFWREAEKAPELFRYNGRTLLGLCMYDGWPYWEPRPAIRFIGQLNSVEWDFFNSYAVYPNSIERAA